MIGIEIDEYRIVSALDRIAASAQGAAPVMRIIAGIMHHEVEENFARQGRPAWLGLKPPINKKRVGGKILQDTGLLAKSILPQSDATSAVVGTNLKYAAIHQFGGKTRPHRIEAKNKKALAFGGVVRRSVNHPGSNIPARPFLAISDAGRDKIVQSVSDYLSRIVK